MTMDPWAPYRVMLADSLRRAVARDGGSHAELLRQQIEADEANHGLAALLCLRLAELAGGRPQVALAPATALALLWEMARVFLSIESQAGGPSLSTAWGMPRVLNAGDAFYALAQDALLLPEDELTAEQRLRAVQALDTAARGYAEALHAAAGKDALEAGQGPLLQAAAALAGLCTNVNAEVMAALQQFAENLAGAGAAAIESGLAGLTRALAANGGSALPRG